MKVELDESKDYTTALNELSKIIIEYAEDKDMSPLEVCYNIHDTHKHKIGSEGYNLYDTLLMHKATNEFQDMIDGNNDLEDFLMGDALVIADKRELIKPVREDLYNRVEELIEGA